MTKYVPLTRDDRTPLLILVEQVRLFQNRPKDEKYNQAIQSMNFKETLEETIDGVLGDVLCGENREEISTFVDIMFALLPRVTNPDPEDLRPEPPVYASGDQRDVERLSLGLAEKLASKPNNNPELRIKLLARLFNILGEVRVWYTLGDQGDPNFYAYKPTTRPRVFDHMMNVAVKSKRSTLLKGRLGNVTKWLKQWDREDSPNCDMELKKNILYNAYKVCLQTDDSVQAQSFLLEYLGLFEEGGSDYDYGDIANAVIQAITSSSINTRSYVELTKLRAIRGLQDNKQYSPLFSLLNIIHEGTTKDFLLYQQENEGYMTELGISPDQVLQKIRFLTLCTIKERGEANPVSFDVLKEALQVGSDDDVEATIIEAVKAGVLEAKIDQLSRRVNISTACQRTFDRKSWSDIGAQLKSWESNTSKVLEHFHRIRHQMG